jgi:tetratricopeptide (TPR) repeat protein
VADNPRIEELRRRVQKDPASIAFAQLAEEYRRAGEHAEAVRVCRTGLAKHPSYLSARVTLGRALIELDQHDEAHTELEYVLRSAPENLAAIRGLAEIHQRRGELPEALKQYQAALDIAQHDPDLEEAVHELTRQLGGGPQARTGAGTANGPGLVLPPPIPFTDSLPEETSQAGTETALVDVPPRAPAVFEPAADTRPTVLSPELEAAADEFTRALEALDAITIDMPAPTLAVESFDRFIVVPEDGRPVAATEWEHAGFDAAPEISSTQPSRPPAPAEDLILPEAAVTTAPSGAATTDPDAAAIADLQDWLDNIVLDRNTPAKH